MKKQTMTMYIVILNLFLAL